MEDAEILAHQSLPGAQFLLRVGAPNMAQSAAPGTFAHLRCDALLPMRRPMSIMRTDPDAGWVEFLYKVVGEGTRLLSGKTAKQRISVMGPIGRGFTVHPKRLRPLLMGGGVGIPPMIFLAQRLQQHEAGFLPFVVMGSEVPFPFASCASRTPVPGMPAEATACLTLLEDWGISSRLTSLQRFAGCFEGYVTDLARKWLEALTPGERAQVAVFACGPEAMLKATAQLANEFSLPCQVSLEEFMACAVGGCAGCTVGIRSPNGIAMKRVCVDGPVFDAATVIWP